MPAQQAPAKLAFEVASIKPGSPGSPIELARSGRRYVKIDDAQAAFGSIQLAGLIQMAYGLPFDQVKGPDWLSDVRFDVQAKLPAGAKKEQVPEMLQTLLEERFKLTVHHDPRAIPVFVLALAKDGPKFRASAAEDPTKAGCTGMVHKVCHKLTMDDLVDMLNLPFRAGMRWGVERLVMDATDLHGSYDFGFDYGPTGPVGDTDTSTASVSTAFDAVRALGLKLEPSERTFDFIVVDHIERVPTEN
jgi:uncharacterized protein (TIGR03435 family)